MKYDEMLLRLTKYDRQSDNDTRMHVSNMFELDPSTYPNEIVAGCMDTCSMLQYEAKPQQECPTERDFIMQRIVNEIARKAEQSMGFGRGELL